MLQEFTVQTEARSQMVDITAAIQNIVRDGGITDGTCCVYVPHTTAGITINENADPSVISDILSELDKIVPWSDGYKHLEGNSAAHIKSSMMGFSQTIIIQNKRLVLGTWQGIYFCEFDGPRRRKVHIKIMSG